MQLAVFLIAYILAIRPSIDHISRQSRNNRILAGRVRQPSRCLVTFYPPLLNPLFGQRPSGHDTRPWICTTLHDRPPTYLPNLGPRFIFRTKAALATKNRWGRISTTQDSDRCGTDFGPLEEERVRHVRGLACLGLGLNAPFQEVGDG